MGRPHISARSKKQPLPFDKESYRLRCLFPSHTASKAEKNFWGLVTTDIKELTSRVTREDLLFIDNLDKQYWALQDEIENEDIDVSIRQSLITQQHDILDEQEKMYTKYLPNEKTKNK